MDRLTSMLAFVKVVETGSLSAVAPHLSITPQMVGRHIQMLEQRLGVTLLTRNARRQHLTEEGRLFYQQCKDILARVDAAEISMHQFNSSPSGQLRITTFNSFGSQVLSPAIPEYLAMFPNVRIELTLNDEVHDFTASPYEVAIRSGEPKDSQLIARPLAPLRYVICASPAYLDKHGIPATPRDLLNHSCLGLASSAFGDRWQLDKEGDEHTVKHAWRFCVNNGHGLRLAALGGAGIVMQPEILIMNDIREGRLTPILENYRLPERPLHVLYRRDQRNVPKISSFVRFMRDRFAQRLV